MKYIFGHWWDMVLDGLEVEWLLHISKLSVITSTQASTGILGPLFRRSVVLNYMH